MVERLFDEYGRTEEKVSEFNAYAGTYRVRGGEIEMTFPELGLRRRCLYEVRFAASELVLKCNWGAGPPPQELPDRMRVLFRRVS
jgi:hypothetical protein